MSSKNLSKAQLKFSELSLKSNSAPIDVKNNNNCSGNNSGRSASPRSFYKQSPEINDLVRFRKAVMQKYVQTHDAHFYNMANALTPQIEDKIREFNRKNDALN